MITALVILFVCILHLNKATLTNVEVTLYRKDVFKLFLEDEIWGIKFYNKTEDIVQVNAIINETKSIEIQNKENIISFDIIYDDIAPIIEKTKSRLNNRTIWKPSMLPDIFFLEYRDWFEYELFIDYILITYPNLASKSYLNYQSIQGRDIPVITLSSGNADGTSKNLYIQVAFFLFFSTFNIQYTSVLFFISIHIATKKKTKINQNRQQLMHENG